MEKIRLIAIVGTDRSGSTLLDKLISSNPGIVSLGEAHWFYLYFKHNHLCTCGLPVRDCRFWEGILEKLRGTSFRSEVVSILGWRKRVQILFERLFLPVSTLQDRYHDFANSYALLCKAALAQSGSRYIVDSCKDITRLSLMHESGMFDIMPIYITRPVEDYVVSERTLPMKYDPNRKMGPKKAVLRWTFRNSEIRYLLPRLNPGYIQISYFKLATDPAFVISAISRRIGVPLVYDPQMVQNADYHFLGGNVMKYRRFTGVSADVKDTSNVFSSPIASPLLGVLNRFFVRDRIGF